MEELVMKIESDIEINKRCLKEETSETMKSMLKIWIKYDEELLTIIRRIEYEKTI